jgi:hypothetical protein
MSQEEFEAVKATADVDNDCAQYFTDEVEVMDKVMTLDYPENYYFFAIPRSHLDRNSNLQQTQGWDGGTFNPLE